MERSIDKEKVMTWLEICGKNNDCSGCCPYSENGFGEYGRCRESLMADAYDLLKEQEPIEPNIRYGNWWFQCGKCKAIIEYRDKFCKECGQEAKWK